MNWNFREHQVEGSNWAIATLRKYGMAYLGWHERTGKTGTAISTIEQSKAKACLIVTKKKAMPGWIEALANFPTEKIYVVINYESIHKVMGKFDIVVLDEAHHAISSFPKPSGTWKKVRVITKGLPILYLSATPYSEHLGLIYHQLKLSDWCPFKEKNAYDFFRRYGIPSMTRTPMGLQETYKKFKDKEILEVIAPIFNFKTRADVGISVEPEVNVIKIKMNENSVLLMSNWVKDRVIYVDGHEIVGDSDAKLRSVHYQIEGGTIKVDQKTWVGTHNNLYCEKLVYILDNYDLSNIAIMANFIAEREMLAKYLPGVRILSSDGDAEGVDLSDVEKLIIYSMSYKTSKYTQRIARQANHNRVLPILVDILVADKPGIGYAIYKSVAIKKENFIKNSYEQCI